jgi:hypothetical protein
VRVLTSAARLRRARHTRQRQAMFLRGGREVAVLGACDGG